MSLIYYMLQISPYLLFILLIVCTAILTAILTHVFRKFHKVKILRAHNEVTGFIFLAVSSFYGLLLSFVVFLVWDQLNSIRTNASKEGSSAMSLYYDIKFYPDTVASKKLMKVYLDYVYNVIDEEYPNMEKMEPGRKTPESLSLVFYEIEHTNPQSNFHAQLVGSMFNHLNEIATYRGLRITSMDSEIPNIIWLPILLGGVITLLFALLLDIENAHLHISINSMMGIFIAMLIFTIIILSHPFTGSIKIEPKAYKEIFTVESWIHAKPCKLKNKILCD
jgi:hypothetical protein